MPLIHVGWLARPACRWPVAPRVSAGWLLFAAAALVMVKKVESPTCPPRLSLLHHPAPRLTPALLNPLFLQAWA